MIKEIAFAGKKIVYGVSGTGKTVMLVHGFGETRTVWERQVAYLEDKFRIITPDLPGTGESALLEEMSMESMAEVLKSILDKEAGDGQIQKPVIIGHSMGGYVVLALAEKYPSVFSAMGLFHSSAFADGDEKKELRRKGIDFIRQHGANKFLKTAAPKLFSSLSKDEMPERIDQFIASLNNFSPESLVYYYEAMIQRPDRQHVLKTTGVPVLFVLGKYDTAIPFEDGLKLCHLPGKAYIHVLHRSGHMGMMEEWEKSNLILERFLTET